MRNPTEAAQDARCTAAALGGYLTVPDVTPLHRSAVAQLRELANLVEALHEKVAESERRKESRTQQVTVTFSATAWDQLCKQLDNPINWNTFSPAWQVSQAIRRAIEEAQDPFPARATVIVTNFHKGDIQP